MTNEAIAAALAAAVRARCNSRTGRTIKMAAAAIGVSVDALDSWLAGRSKVPAWAILALQGWFAKAGDHGFAAEVLGFGAHGGDECLWVDDDGVLMAAPHGHEGLARQLLGGDGATQWGAYAIRAAGWIAITRRADGVLVLALSEARAAPAALARVSAWLPGPVPVLAGIELRMLSGRDWRTIGYDTVGALRRDLDALAVQGLPAPVATRISADRRALDRVCDPVMAQALQHWDGSLTGAQAIAQAVAAGGGGERSAMFQRQPGGGYVCAGLGGQLHIDRGIVGRPLHQLGTGDYWRTVAEHFDLTLAGGVPTVHRIDVRSGGDHGLYDRLALPVDVDGMPGVEVVSLVIERPARVVLS